MGPAESQGSGKRRNCGKREDMASSKHAKGTKPFNGIAAKFIILILLQNYVFEF